MLAETTLAPNRTPPRRVRASAFSGDTKRPRRTDPRAPRRFHSPPFRDESCGGRSLPSAAAAPPGQRFGGLDGRISMREGSALGGNASRSVTMRAMSSGWIFQASSGDGVLPLK